MLPYVLDSAQILKIFHFQMLCPIQQIWNIEIVDIITGQNVWIDFTNEIRPSLQQFLWIKHEFCFKFCPSDAVFFMEKAYRFFCIRYNL